MPRAKKSTGSRATTPEQEEQKLISLATELAEQQLRDGTASPSVITHFLKLGTSREKLEQERLESENAMLRAKTEALAANSRIEELFQEALSSFRSYHGDDDSDDVEAELF